jgi:hypothetical protein
MLTPLPHSERRSHVQPISTRRCSGARLKSRVEPTGSPLLQTAKGASSPAASASSNQRSKLFGQAM